MNFTEEHVDLAARKIIAAVPSETDFSVLRMLSANFHGLVHIKHVRLRVAATLWTAKEARICIPFPPDSYISKLSFRSEDPLCYHRNIRLSRIPKFHLHLGSVI